MRQSSRVLALALSLLLAAGALAGCGGAKQAPTPAAPAQQEAGQSQAEPAPRADPVSLVLWTHFNDGERELLRKYADEWQSQTGNTVSIEQAQGGFAEFAAAVQSGVGPDLLYGLPHDHLGNFQKAGLLAEVPAGLINPADYVDVAIQAVSVAGKMYGVPIGMEAIGLFYNTSIVSEAPQDWDTFLAIAREKGFMYDAPSPYFSFGFMAGHGAYVFKDTGGALDPSDIGLGNAGAVQGLQLINDLVHKYQTMPPDVNYDVAKGKFQSGASAFYLSGSWDVQGFKDAGVPFAIAPMPSLPNGQPFRPFVGVQSGFVSSESKYQEASWDLVKFLQTKTTDFDLTVANRIPVLKAGWETAEFKNHPFISAFAGSAENGIPMPNIPEMQAVWPPMAQAVQLVFLGQASPEDAAGAMVQQIKEGIASQK